MNIEDVLSLIIARTTDTLELNSDRAIGDMTIDKALTTIQRLQDIRDREAQYVRSKFKSPYVKKAQKKKSNGL